MNIGNQPYRTIWLKPGDPTTVQVIDQRFLPHQLLVKDLKTLEDAEQAIKEMIVRGAPLIGVTAAYGLYLAALKAPVQLHLFENYMADAADRLLATRPTAINLRWAIQKQMEAIAYGTTAEAKIKIALENANSLADEDIETCRK